MSAIAEPPVASGVPPASPVPAAAPAATPRAPAKSAAANLPEGLKVDHSHDASEFFEAHKAANQPAKPAAAASPAPAAKEPVAAPAAAEPVAPVEAKDKGIAGQLADRFLPESAKVKAEVRPQEDAPALAANAHPEDALSLGKESSQRARENFDNLKSITKTLREQVAARDREVQEAKSEVERLKSGAVPVDTPELQKLRAEHKAMADRLLVLDLQSHPDYQREFVAPKSAAEEEARNILAAAGITNVDLEAILNKDPVSFRKELSALAQKLPTALDQADFATQMRAAHTLNHKAKDAVARAGEIGSALRQKTVAEQRAAFDTTFAQSLGALNIQELVAPAGSPPEDVAAVAAFNEGIRAIRPNAEKIALGTTDARGISQAAIKAAAYEFQVTRAMPMMSKLISIKEARIADLESQLKGIRDRNPNRNIGGVPSSGGGKRPEDMSHSEAAEYFAGLGRGGS